MGWDTWGTRPACSDPRTAYDRLPRDDVAMTPTNDDGLEDWHGFPVVAVGPLAHGALGRVPDWCRRLDAPRLGQQSWTRASLAIVAIHADDDLHFDACAEICAALRASRIHPLVVALAARPNDRRAADRGWQRRLARAWDAIVVTVPLEPAEAHERVAHACTEALVQCGLIGIDFADVRVAPRAGIGALFEWSVAIPMVRDELLPPELVQRYMRAHAPAFGQCTMRFVPNATLAELNDLASRISEFFPANSNVLWAAPSRDDAVLCERMEIALLLVDDAYPVAAISEPMLPSMRDPY